MFLAVLNIFTVAIAGAMKPDKHNLASKYIKFLSSKYLREEHH